MSSPRSVRALRTFVSTLETALPGKLRGMFRFGVRAFVLAPIVSCNSNARTAHHGSRAAAEQAMFRLLGHPRIARLLWQRIARLSPLTDADVVDVDYSNLGPLAILGFARQTGRGRAVPVLMRALASNTQGLQKKRPKYQVLRDAYNAWKATVQADQYSYVVKSLRLLRYLYKVQPRLAFDRGFMSPVVAQFLCDNHWLFYLRAREDRYVSYRGERRRIGSFRKGSYHVDWAGRRLRLVVGSTKVKHPMPWYILTNDERTANKQVIRYYYHRFEIEESFRDVKSLFRLKYTQLKTYRSLGVILCFLSIALICALAATSKDNTVRQPKTPHSKKQLSLVRIWQESVRTALQAAAVKRWGLG